MRADELTQTHVNQTITFNDPWQGPTTGRIIDLYDDPGYYGPTIAIMIHNPTWKHAYDTYHLDGGVEVDIVK